MNKAVVLGANYYIGLSAIRSLGEEGVHVVAVDYQTDGAYGLKSKYLKESLIGPNYRTDTEAFIAFLIDYAKKQDEKPVLLPCADPYVEVTDAYRDELSKWFLLPGMPQGLQTSLLEKDSLNTYCLKFGVKVPESLTTGMDNLYERIEKEIGFPCLVKPANSHAFVAVFRTKMFKVYSMSELKEALEKAKNQKLEVIIQRIIPGFDDHMYTYDAHLNEESKVTHWLSCQKYRQYPINFGASVYTTQKYVPELHKIGAPFLEGVGYKGFAEIEFKKDATTGDFYLIEINTRYSNLNNLVKKAGLNMPYITYRELTGNPLEPKAIEKDTGIVFWYAYEDMLAVKAYLKAKQLSLLHVLKSYFTKKAYAIWDIKDPMPLFAFQGQLLTKLFKKVTRR
ncbi:MULTISPECIES: carboxylate--amine ligase [unclassified Fusibacter]|uniref:carboxylate--amine ligase n=1 Tax=unclassified Fusibacter TaxID=2624464 RepID=UPI0010107E3E|nr:MULTISPECIES: carboxylate--amine ligase [unclassified Fusibacter]MCK8060022.1 carboxylate--amine ligase [Fusibacter sp. A2]NPE22162.1 carboxylate--amine ligase [Fusibacter sp. A1]RXV60939.1 carboxylate--amine ligase [Fusibacter sp. A1]